MNQNYLIQFRAKLKCYKQNINR